MGNERTPESRELDILSYIVNFINHYQYPPAIREICDDLGIPSTSHVNGFLRNLELDGTIELGGNRARSYRLTLDPHPVDFRAGNPELNPIQPYEDCIKAKPAKE